MPFSIATFNTRDFFDDAAPFVIGELDRDGVFGPAEQARARALYRAKLAAMAAVVRRLDADVVAFQEVESARVLDDLRALLPAREGVPHGGYGPAAAARGDRRGIACGLLSRFPVTFVRDHVERGLPFPAIVEGDPAPFAGQLYTHRGVLEATIALPDGAALALYVVHFKSNLPMPLERPDGTVVPIADHRAWAEGITRSLVTRVAEALFVRGLVDARLDQDPDALVAVAGDFNDYEASVPVRAVAGDLVLAGLAPGATPAPADVVERLRGRALYPCARAVPPAARYSVMFRGAPQQIDHILVSRALWSRFASARFLNETLGESLADGSLESDHAPLRAEFV